VTFDVLQADLEPEPNGKEGADCRSGSIAPLSTRLAGAAEPEENDPLTPLKSPKGSGERWRRVHPSAWRNR
jgi:hypothetical protein